MKSMLKRAISIVLVAILLISALPVASFATITISDNDVYLVVPETIYMTPTMGEATTPQYYVNNTFNSSTNAVTLDAVNNATKGKFYFKCPGATSITVTASVGTQNLNSFTLTSTNGVFSKTDYTFTSLTAANGVTAGSTKLLKWTVSTTFDGVAETYTAYTVLYSPFLAPVAASGKLWALHRWGKVLGGYTQSINAEVQGASWISGIHSISSQHEASAGNGLSFNAVNTNNLNPIFGNISIPSGGNGFDVSEYRTSGTLNSLAHINKPSEEIKTNSDDPIYQISVNSYKGNLTIDNNRYSNFTQVPNLNVGFVITYIGGSDRVFESRNTKLMYYASDFTDIYNNANVYNTLSKNTWNQVNGTTDNDYQFLNQKGNLIVSQLDGLSLSSTPYPHINNPVYIGLWDRNIDSNSKTYVFKGAASLYGYYANAGHTITPSINCMSLLNVTIVDKQALRSSITNATKFPLNRALYNCTDGEWNTHIANVENAYAKLGNPAATQTDINTAVNLLNSSISTVSASMTATLKAHHYAFVKVLETNGSFNNRYAYHSTLTPNANDTKTGVLANQKVQFTNNTYSGYTYIGYKKANATTWGSTNSATSVTYNRAYNTFSSPNVYFHYKAPDASLLFDLGNNATYDYVCSTVLNGSVGTVYRIPSAVPTREGYTFERWVYSGDGSYNQSNNTVTFGTQNQLRAIWTPKIENEYIYINHATKKRIDILANDTGLVETYGRDSIRILGISLTDTTNPADYSDTYYAPDGGILRISSIEDPSKINHVDYIPPVGFIDDAVKVYLLIAATDYNGADHYYVSHLFLCPARTVMYYAPMGEDFVYFDDPNIPGRFGRWSENGVNINGIYSGIGYYDTYEEINYINTPGYCKIFDNPAMASNGYLLTHHAEVDPTYNNKPINFKFVGTGFDIYAVMDNQRAPLVVSVDGKKYIVDPNAHFIHDGGEEFIPGDGGYEHTTELWRLYTFDKKTAHAPVFSITDLPFGSHDVVIEARYAKAFNHSGYSFLNADITGIRVHNPMGEDSTYDSNMRVISFEKVKDLTICQDQEPDVYLLANRESIPTELYERYGAANEIYLAPQHTIAFNVDTSAAENSKVYLSGRYAKSLNNVTTQVSAVIKVSCDNQTLETEFNTQAEQFREIADFSMSPGVHTITVTNKSDVPVSLCNIMVCDVNSLFVSYPNVVYSAPELSTVMSLLSRPVTVEGGSQFYPTSIEATEPTDIEEGDTTEITVNTAKDVARLTINGENAHRSNGEDGYNWTIPFTANSVGTQSFEIVAYNSSGIRSEATTITVDVNEKTVIATEEPTDPTEPTEPTEPTDPTEPVAPTAPEEPEEIKTKIQIFFEKLKHIFSVIINFFKNLF